MHRVVSTRSMYVVLAAKNTKNQTDQRTLGKVYMSNKYIATHTIIDADDRLVG